jgi:hypothetical protein
MTHQPPIIWRKSSYSVGNNNCVELADAGTEILLRDSKHPEQGHCTFTKAEMADFIRRVKAGELDHLV